MPVADSISAKLAKLGVRRMLLAIHDISFPCDPDEDVGRGTPASRASMRLYAYAKSLGFTGLQLGPQGQTSRSNPSPYDGTIFSRHIGTISIGSLRRGGAFEGLVDEAILDSALVARPGGLAQHEHAYDASHAFVARAWQAVLAGARPDLRARAAVFADANRRWLASDARYEGLAVSTGYRGFRDWPAGHATVDPHLEAAYGFGQFLAHAEHARVRDELARLGLVIYGDLQIGLSDRDTWAYSDAFLPGYRMGAPPSRTNPDGQPWGYPVLDPRRRDGRSGELVRARADKSFEDYDGLRIDHPHGLVCPWVYGADAPDPGASVRDGSRLLDSPDRADLAAYAIARLDQLDPSVARHADGWVRDLDDDQVRRYAELVEVIVDSARRHGRDPADLSMEVLSTMPYPLGRVLARYGLGRWRVTHKAKLDDPRDVYRADAARRPDWVMLGNHDTAPIFAVIAAWSSEQRDAWARHLAESLKLATPERLAEPGFLATAMLAELFASQAENVSIFFADLFGLVERFNVPGLVDEANWRLRLPADFAELHARRLARGEALDLELALDLAIASGTPRRAGESSG